LAAEWFALPNGLEVDVVSGRCERGALALLLPVGADQDPEGHSGMARVLAHLLGAASPDATVTVGRDHILYAMPLEGSPTSALTDVAARLAHLEVSDDDLTRARAAVLADLARMRGGDPALTAESYAVEAIQPSSGEGWRGGLESEIESIDRLALEAFVSAAFRPGHARLVVIGTEDLAALRPAMERTLGALPAGDAPATRAPGTGRVLGTLVMGDAPSVIVIAVPAPPIHDPLFAPFLIHASRLLAAATPSTFQASYDWVARPETLFITGPVQAGETPEAAASRIRFEMATPLTALLAPADVTATEERFARLLGADDLSPACAEPLPLAIARARRAQLGIDALHLDDAIGSVTEDSLREAASAFDAAHATAVAGGGTLR